MTVAIAWREFRVMWVSPLPWVLGALFHATLGVLGWAQLGERSQAVFQPIVPIAGFLLLLVAPVLASRSLAEEIRSGTLELLFVAGVRRGAIVAGKYLAVLATMVAITAPVSLFALVLSLWGEPDGGPVVSGMAGLVLMAVALSAVGVLSSSLTSSQPVAAIGGLFAVLVLWFAHTGSEALAAGGFLGAFSISERLRSFAGGLVDLGDVAFFLAAAVAALALAVLAVEARRRR